MNRLYRIHGIVIRSDWELPLLDLADGVASVEILRCFADDMHQAAAQAIPRPIPPEWYTVASLHDGSTFMRFPSLFDFIISNDGRTIWAHRWSEAYTQAFRTYLLTHALSYALLEQGIEQLHATCVLIDTVAVAFLGNSFFGKSTLAAEFVRSRYKLITDDMLVLNETSEGFHVTPGVRHIKLFPEIAPLLLGQSVQAERMNPLTEKMIIPLANDQFHPKHAPLRTLYVLAHPTARQHQAAVQIKTISASEAFVELCKGAFNSDAFKAERLMRQFAFATNIASKVPLKLLSFGNGVASLHAVRDAVLSDIG